MLFSDLIGHIQFMHIAYKQMPNGVGILNELS